MHSYLSYDALCAHRRGRGDKHNNILECSICIIMMCHMNTGENFGSATKCIFFAIRRTILVPEVCPYISICAMMHHVHTGEAMVTSNKI